MIIIDEEKITVKGPEQQVMQELCHGVAEISLVISTRMKIPQDLVIGDVVLGSTLGKYEIRLADDTNPAIKGFCKDCDLSFYPTHPNTKNDLKCKFFEASDGGAFKKIPNG